MSEFLTCNFHTHTFRCQHAWGTEREYIEAAIKMGIKTLGFSDHIPCPYGNGFVSRVKMRMEEAPEYVAAIRQLAKEYEKDIKIYVGFEAEYLPAYYERQMDMFRELKMDYQILGQHYISDYENPYTGSPTDSEDLLKKYVDLVLEGVGTGSYSYVAHPDLTPFTGDAAVYEREMRRMLAALKKMDTPVEINMLGMTTNRNYPNPTFWKMAGEMGNKAVIGLDAHHTDHFYNKESYQKCCALADACGVQILTEGRLEGGRIVFRD